MSEPQVVGASGHVPSQWGEMLGTGRPMNSLPPKPRRSSPASLRSSLAQEQRRCQFKNWHPYPSLVSRVQECTFYEDYRLVLLCSQRAFMMAVTGMRIWVWNKPCYFLPGCKVNSEDQTNVLLTPMRYSVSGMRGGGHILTQAGVAAEDSVVRHEGIFTSSCNFHVLLFFYS